MTALPPAGVLAKRLEHKLSTVRFYLTAKDTDGALVHLEQAQQIVTQLQEAMG